MPIEEGMEVLADRHCERLLAGGGVGILGLGGDEPPILRPVNFALRAGCLWMRTGEGQILSAARSKRPASFVIHAIDRLEHLGWSVVVEGRLAERAEGETAADLPLRPWAGGKRDHLVALSLDRVSGRRIPAPGARD